MRRKELSRAFYNALMLPFIAVVLCGCLDEKAGTEDEGGFVPGSRNSAPVISGNPTTAINHGDMYSFQPTASDSDGDVLTFSIDNQPVWANFNTGTGAMSGQPTLGNVGVYSDIKITVSDGSASDSLPRFAVSVDQVGIASTTLSWVAPTENEDGTALVDLAGYKIYWGTIPGTYTHSVKIDNPGLTTYVVSDLAPGTYEFVATSFNNAGIESVYSNPATKVLN